MHGLVNYRGELDHAIKSVLAPHNAAGSGISEVCRSAYTTRSRRIVAYRRSLGAEAASAGAYAVGPTCLPVPGLAG